VTLDRNQEQNDMSFYACQAKFFELRVKEFLAMTGITGSWSRGEFSALHDFARPKLLTSVFCPTGARRTDDGQRVI
jgi:hypothetical protein